MTNESESESEDDLFNDLIGTDVREQQHYNGDLVMLYDLNEQNTVNIKLLYSAQVPMTAIYKGKHPRYSCDLYWTQRYSQKALS